MGGLNRRSFLQLTTYGLSGILLQNKIPFNFVPYVTHGDRDTNKVALTFDDGWEEDQSQAVLDVLSHYDIQASLFVVGKSLIVNEKLWHSALDDGHEIFNHTYGHEKLSDPEVSFSDEIGGWEKAYRSRFGEPQKIIRLPYNEGANSSYLYGWLSNHEYEAVIGWSKSSGDTKHYPSLDAKIQSIIENTNNLKGGDIVLFHFLESSAQALPNTIESAYDNNLEFVKLTDLPGTPVYKPPVDIEPELPRDYRKLLKFY